MSKITFVIGGSRSGKSSFAVDMAKKSGKNVAFIATCLPEDPEMKERVKLHKKERPGSWKTFEGFEDIELVLKKCGAGFDVVVIDCLTLLVSNLMFSGFSETEIKNKISKVLNALKKLKANSIIISNEVGLGIVPGNKIARDFRDTAGRMNQIVAEKSDEVVFMAAGLPIRLKGKNG